MFQFTCSGTDFPSRRVPIGLKRTAPRQLHNPIGYSARPPYGSKGCSIVPQRGAELDPLRGYGEKANDPPVRRGVEKAINKPNPVRDDQQGQQNQRENDQETLHAGIKEDLIALVEGEDPLAEIEREAMPAQKIQAQEAINLDEFRAFVGDNLEVLPLRSQRLK